MLRPLKSNVLIEPDATGPRMEETRNGVVLVTGGANAMAGLVGGEVRVSDKYGDWIPTSGTVVDVGPLVEDIAIGDRVVFSPEVGMRVTEGGTEYLLIRDEDVDAVVMPGVTAEFIEANA